MNVHSGLHSKREPSLFHCNPILYAHEMPITRTSIVNFPNIYITFYFSTPTWPINWLINRLPTLVRFLPTGQHHRYHRPRPSSIYNRKGRPMETGIERSIVNGQCSQMRSAPIVVVSSPTHPLQTAISNQRPSYR